MDEFIEYIVNRYNPISIIVYGSYANGTDNLNSDFDALVISKDYKQFHDTSFVNGVQLDVFVYPESYFSGAYNCEDFIQIADSKILLDTTGIGEALKNNVSTYISERKTKTDDEIKADIDWCIKMLARTQRDDIEGMYRWHWVLIDSLEIFCDTVHNIYLGPKKTLKWMQENYPDAFDLYQKALCNLNKESLTNWIMHLKSIA